MHKAVSVLPNCEKFSLPGNNKDNSLAVFSSICNVFSDVRTTHEIPFMPTYSVSTLLQIIQNFISGEFLLLPTVKNKNNTFVTKGQSDCRWGECVWWGGMCTRGHAWQQRWPLQQMVHILLECILILGPRTLPSLLFNTLQGATVVDFSWMSRV